MDSHYFNDAGRLVLDQYGHYVIPDFFYDPVLANDELQLPKRMPKGVEVPLAARARFRIKFRTAQLVDKLYSPRGWVHGSSNPLSVLEFVVRDNPGRGLGGGVQFVAKQSEIVVDEITDLWDGHVLNAGEILKLKNGTYGD